MATPFIFKRNDYSKYDFVKIPNHVSVKIALDLKKLLVDNSLLDVSQADLEANLFKLMKRRGFGDEYIKRYKMMTSAPLTSSPVWTRDFSSPEELMTEFCRECRIIWKGLAGDLRKATKDGKPIIIEGIHLDPRIFLMEEHKLLPPPTADYKEPNFSKVKDHKEIQRESNHSIGLGSQSNGKDLYPENVSSDGASSESDKLADSLKSMDIVEKISENTEPVSRNKFSGHAGETVNDSGADQNPAHRKQTSGDLPIFVPIVLRMADFDHKAFLEEWVATRTFTEKHPAQVKDKVITNLMTIQDYLCSFTSQGLTVVDVSAATFPQTLDWLHNYLLQDWLANELIVHNKFSSSYFQCLEQGF
uniref:ATP/GTP nucleotide-binding protein n=1 Tax=Solanum tuberosum TaxID=4113 RepID=M1BY74_SOLTU